ncbi:DinB family protein [Pseudochryseolinea flava]|nr:DinB family protein [Pseudochryseolinea flava]
MNVVVQDSVKELRHVINEYASRIASIPDAEMSVKPRPEKWSKKEVVGHLVDSAQNNLRRFICGQYESNPSISYEQDFWVTANAYQHMTTSDVINLWKLLNERISVILETMPSENYERQCIAGGHARTLAWLAQDYVKHLKHHLNQIIPNAFDIKYP